MTRFGTYTLLALVAGAALVWAVRTIDVRAVEAFYGIAQTPETEVNFNYPVEVRSVDVRAGDLVDSGQILLVVERARTQERLADQTFRIDELRAEQALLGQRLRGELTRLEADLAADTTELSAERKRVAEELAYRRRLVAAVAGDDDAATYRPLETQLAAIEAELATQRRAYARRRADLERQLALAGRPADAQVRRLTAERDFDEAQAAIRVEIRAPGAGVVGTVNVKSGEHKSSFAPLLTYYEPHPTQVLSYIHEDKLLSAAVGDSVWVSSLANPGYRTRGVITGLGSRIVEIPRRLRRLPEVSTYGREVAVALPAGNRFLQQEKVELNFFRDER